MALAKTVMSMLSAASIAQAMAMTRVGGANGAMSRDLAPLQAPTPAVQTANQTIPRLSTGVEYVLSSAGVANGQIVVNFHTGAARPELAEFTTGGVMMQVDKFMAWGLTKTAWATVGLTDFQGEWEVQFDYSIPSSRFSQFNGYLYMVLDRSVGNVRQIGDVLFGWMSGRCDTYGANVVVVTPNPPDTCSLLALTDVPFRMLVSRDATTGYLTIKIYRTDTMALQVEVEVQRDTPFTEDVPISFYINDMRLDWSDVRVLRGSTMSGGTGGGSGEAVGDPHLQNVHGERFDLMQEGRHVLINIPRGTGAEQAILRVQADARRLGGQCADLYFQELNVTGSWAEAKQAGGYHYSVSQSDAETPKWVALGKVELKVAQGRTDSGLKYLNVYVKHLARAGFAIGGLLGEDDHEDVMTPPEPCGQKLSLARGITAPSAFSVAEASLA